MSVAAEQVAVTSHGVSAPVDEMLAFDASGWSAAEVATVPLEPTPIDRQPSAYVRAAWRDRPRSDIRELEVSSLTGPDAIALRLEWEAPRPSRAISDINAYADGAAVLLPVDGVNLAHETMGTEEHPVQGWHWRAGTADPFVVTATGLGTAQRHSGHGVVGAGEWDDGRWRVVLARALDGGGDGDGDAVPLGRGSCVPVAFAVWSGAAGERGGLKAFSPSPVELVVGG